MALKIVICICLALLLMEYSSGAPQARKDQDLRKSFVEFLQQDKELSSLLEKSNLEGLSLSRNIRQADVEEDDMNADGQDAPPKDGFFDRAAKFVMEVLQRFLKWVNSDN